MSDTRLAQRHGLLTLTLALVACAAPVPLPEPASQAIVAPNANLFVQGIPPVPQGLADAVARYTEFRGHSFVEWHPTRREMLIAYRKPGASTTQIYRLRSPLAEPEPLTDEREPVSQASYEPRDGRYIVYMKSGGGDEAFQLHRLDLETMRSAQLSDPRQRHAMQGWLRKSGHLLVSSLPLDRTAQGGRRERIEQTLSVLDPADPSNPAVSRVIATLPGAGWQVSDVSPDERQIALIRHLSVTQSELWVLDVGSGRRRQLLPAAHGAKAAYGGARFRGDGAHLVLTSDAAGEFRELFMFNAATGAVQRIESGTRWDIDDTALSSDGRALALKTNEDGTDVLRLYDGDGLPAVVQPALPAGTIGNVEFHRARDEIAFSQSTAQGPAQVFSIDAHSGAVQQWTRAQGHPDVDRGRFAPQRLVRWKSFDGLAISGWLSMPPARFGGRRPVLIDIHGGPESQAKAGFLGRSQYFVQELGVAVIRPNVRGSSGYGKTFVALDNGIQREDSVRDIGALLDWIALQSDLDVSRVVVAGASYGGYMTLASAVHYSDRLAGAIDVVGISHFLTFLEGTESYRRDLRRAEYGDERDPSMREFLGRISPLANAQRIGKPLFVVAGRNDPRVAWTEAEQIVAKVRGNGTPVWYLRAENEGHGFARKENADFQFYAMVMFLRQVMKL